MNGHVTDEQVSAAVARRDRGELATLRGLLVAQKKEIEAQLADDKGQMMEERAGHLEAGLHPREAQARATATSDHDWRGRAIFACSKIDGRLSRIKSAIQAMSAAPVEVNKKTGVPEARPLDVIVLRGTAEEVAEHLRSCGKKVAAMAPHDGALVVVLWANT